MKEQITLCESCKSNYIYAGIQVELDRSVAVKEPCDICGYRTGWTYRIDRGWQKICGGVTDGHGRINKT